MFKLASDGITYLPDPETKKILMNFCDYHLSAPHIAVEAGLVALPMVYNYIFRDLGLFIYSFAQY